MPNIAAAGLTNESIWKFWPGKFERRNEAAFDQKLVRIWLPVLTLAAKILIKSDLSGKPWQGSNNEDLIYNPVERLICDLGTRLEPATVVFQDADQGVQDPAAADGGGVPHRAALHDRKEEQRRDKSKKKVFLFNWFQGFEARQTFSTVKAVPHEAISYVSAFYLKTNTFYSDKTEHLSNTTY